MSALRKIRGISNPNEQFKQMSLLYRDLLAEESTVARPFASESLPLFSALSPERKLVGLNDLATALEVFEEMRAEGHSLRDTPKLLWRALHKIGYVPHSDVFDKIEDEDVINVYSLDQKLVFQNLRFFDFVSVTLEQLYTLSWREMTRRDPAAEQKILHHGIEILSGRTTKTIDPEIDEHLCEEVDTAEMTKFFIKVRYMSPLRANDAVCGAITINRCRLA